jgi:hypothetical protein
MPRNLRIGEPSVGFVRYIGAGQASDNLANAMAFAARGKLTDVAVAIVWDRFLLEPLWGSGYLE